MGQPVIFVTRKLPANVELRASQQFDAKLNQEDVPFSEAERLSKSEDCDAILTCAGEVWSRETLMSLPERVKILATFSVGTDHIDLKAAHERGLVISNTPDVLTEATADIAMLCLLGAAKRAHEAQTMLRQSAWTGWCPTQLIGADLFGQTLGIIGMGRIGQAMARRARAFGMTIHYHNRRPLDDELAEGAVFHASVETLLETCRYVSLNCPSTPETRQMINASTIAMMRKDAILINTARGDLVVDQDLIEALKNKRIYAAGLDVYTGEPNIHPGYATLTNAFLLPHLGSATEMTREAMGMMCLDNIDACLGGRAVPNRIEAS